MMYSALLLLLNAAFISTASPSTETYTYVSLNTGVFRGLVTGNGTDRFLGIPFAQPPVGNLRFKAPVPITTRAATVQDALAFSNACPQPPNPALLGAPVGEDCLHMNAWKLIYVQS